MCRFGPHIDPPLARIPAELKELGFTFFQTTLRNPTRLAKEGVPDLDDQAAYRASSAGLRGVVHGSLIISLASPDPRIRNSSATALVSDANLAAELDLIGVCFHTGYQKGHESRDAAHDAVVYKLTSVLQKLKPGARVLMENGCEGTELGQTIEELAKVIIPLNPDPAQFGLVLDTCHLHVAGFDLANPDAPDILATQLEASGLSKYLAVLHVNDAKEACGSHRDRHAIPGEGTIGEGLVRLVNHQAFKHLPGVLEIDPAKTPAGIAFLEQQSL